MLISGARGCLGTVHWYVFGLVGISFRLETKPLRYTGEISRAQTNWYEGIKIHSGLRRVK